MSKDKKRNSVTGDHPWYNKSFVDEIGPERALNMPDASRPHHNKIEDHLLPEQAIKLMTTIWGKSKGDTKWHFQEVLDDPEYICVTFEKNDAISFWFKKHPGNRVRNILGAYGFTLMMHAVLPNPEQYPEVEGENPIALCITNK